MNCIKIKIIYTVTSVCNVFKIFIQIQIRRESWYRTRESEKKVSRKVERPQAA